MTGAGHSHPQRHPGDGWLPRAEHVWINHVSGLTEAHLPGLLLAWRRHPARPAEWQGWVIYAELGSAAGGGGPFIRQSWVEATGIQPRG
ncbi:hypothetical protein [Nocardioides flavescens]|uniref:Uncharacterized protein n=1 Tax=Nocardioides flavescens TaxID=2691959 RepID=A0A6L7EYF7_9ACTN|nr:hypothetical protein [Nocardioides flavescens]MXG90658.1 hypothetical protein [Nocardioides flavescens]